MMERMFSGIQPTNQLTLGNYIGAIKSWVEYQHDYDSLFCVVDLHALTAVRRVSTLTQSTLYNVAVYLASGIDPKHSTVFIQSHVPELLELNWILNCFGYMGELNRMTQYKAKSKDAGENIGVGLFTYPILMAADILLYQSALIPVGEDQRQHIELTRDIALRINRLYDQDIFTMPKAFIPKLGAKIMDLQEPEVKMSKSAVNEKGTLFLTDSEKQLTQKIKSATTDSGESVTGEESELSPGLINLFTIQAALKAKSFEDIWQNYVGKQYGYVKKDTAEIVVEALKPLNQEVERLLKNPDFLHDLLKQGAERARNLAIPTLKVMKEKLGLLEL